MALFVLFFTSKNYSNGALTENSVFSLFSSPKSMSLTYSGNLSVGTGSMTGTGNVNIE